MAEDKIISLPLLKQKRAAYRAAGQTVVFTNGCFDLIHAGHVSYLTEAAGLGDVLVLGLNTDRSVRRIKGNKRPVIPEFQRARVVASLEMVDHVILFDAPDPEDLIQAIGPDVLVKGADWPESRIAGARFVREQGGEVARIPLEPEISTTLIIRRICSLYGPAEVVVSATELSSHAPSKDGRQGMRDKR